MATGLAIAGGVIGAFGAYSGYKSRKAANKAAKKLGFANAELQRKETEAAVGRAEQSHERTEATSEALLGARGFSMIYAGTDFENVSQDRKSSGAAYLKSMREQHREDIDWMKTSGLSRAALIEAEARANYRAGNNMATAGLISGIGGSIASFGSAAQSYGQYGWGLPSFGGGDPIPKAG